MNEPTLGELAMQVAAKLARKRFRGYPDQAERVADSQSTAWELALTAGPGATPGTVAKYAVRRVVVGRQLPESARSVTGPNPNGKAKPKRSDFNPERVADRQGSPGTWVPFALDYEAWRGRLPDRKRAVADALALGDRTEEAAQRFDCSDGRISQIRRELKEDWSAFQGAGL